VPEHIVVAVDGSETARRALRWAVEEGAAGDAAATVLHAREPHLGGRLGRHRSSEPGEDASLALLDAALTAEVPADAAPSIRRLSVRCGAAEAIVTAAQDADLVVMGRRGLDGFDGMLLGSVTDQVGRHAPCPVVVVPPPAEGGGT
jgi:nucleotide-binding universal stress UspA family protein